MDPNKAWLDWRHIRERLKNLQSLRSPQFIVKTVDNALEEYKAIFERKEGWRRINPGPVRLGGPYSAEEVKALRAYKRSMLRRSLPNAAPCRVCKWIHPSSCSAFTNPHTAERFTLNKEQIRQLREIHIAMAAKEPGVRNADLIADTGHVDVSGAWTRSHRKKYNALIDRTVQGVKGLVAIKEPRPAV